jgi:uncharacterized damage-inducible protein DinB
MDLSTIADLYRYNRWANRRVVQATAALAPDAFTAVLPSSYPSVRDTLVHVLWSEWIWLQRWKGESPRTLFAPTAFPDAAALSSRWAELQAEQAEWLGSLSEERLAASVRYVNVQGQTWEYALWKQMLHVVNHSSYHRGQVATLLRQLGLQPPATDFLVFYDEAGGA